MVCTFLALSICAWAAPRVAIVRMVGGEAKLAGKPLQTPQMAEEGQVLVVERGGEVRVQVLGSNKEMTLKGPKTLTLRRADLLKSAKALPRDKVAVAAEIGNLQRSAAGTSRVEDYNVVGWSVEDPTLSEDGNYLSQVKLTQILHVTPSNPLELSIFRVDGKASASVLSETYVATLPEVIKFEENSIAPGEIYLLDVQYQANGGHYRRYFRPLSEDETAALAAADKTLRQENSIASLTHLAGLYQDFDQTAQAAEVLQKIVEHPEFRGLDAKPREELLVQLNKARRSLDVPAYTAPSKTEGPPSP